MSARSELENDISKWQKSKYDCPACSRKLWSLQLEGSTLYWCGIGPIEKLRKNVEEEPEYHESN